jgi:hypothetical protein
MCFDAVGSDLIILIFPKIYFFEASLFRAFGMNYLFRQNASFSTEKAAFWSKYSNEVFDRFGILYCILYCTSQLRKCTIGVNN